MLENNTFHRTAGEYALFRPTYPEALFQWIASQADRKQVAWDAATGNGQAAASLVKCFSRVEATDISEMQIDRAPVIPGVKFSRSASEKTAFPDNHFDAVISANGIHWFNLAEFYREVLRVSRPNAVIAVWCYWMPHSSGDKEVDAILKRDFLPKIDAFWPAATNLARDRYQTLEFPFERLSPPPFTAVSEFSLDTFCGFLSTWSAVSLFREHRNSDPITALRQELAQIWGEKRKISMELFIKAGKIRK